MFNAIDVLQEGELSIEGIEEFFLKHELKNNADAIYDAMTRIFGEEKISLRRFML